MQRESREAGITLVELLVAMTIMSVVAAMLILTWTSLSASFAHTTRSSDARDFARQAASRMERELRDAEAQLTTGNYKGLPAILWASANKIIFVTTFNNAGNDMPAAQPLAMMYYLDHGTLYMRRDANDDKQWDDPNARELVPYVVNQSAEVAVKTPVFSYTYVADDGSFVTMHPADDSVSLSEALRARIVSVSFTLLVDVNPGHAPAPMTLTTTAQLRNQRWF
jgi:type II secretory pathway component PulJ